jgi:hypothetical protein
MDKNLLAVRPASAQQSDAAVIGPTGQARLGLADDPRRLEHKKDEIQVALKVYVTIFDILSITFPEDM